MRISKKTDYAIRALFTLVDEYGKGPIPIRVLAERNNIPKAFLEHIVLDMKAQGWVESAPGKKGGYVLGRDPNQITMGEVVRYFDGALAPVEFASAANPGGSEQEGARRFGEVLMQIRNMTNKLMDESTLAAVCSGTPAVREAYLDSMMGGLGI